MSAMAGALERELEKVEHYRLGAGLALPQPADIARSVTLMRAAVVAGMVVSGLLFAILPSHHKTTVRG
jgi:cobalamin biosynthesis protein CobD/CbiB